MVFETFCLSSSTGKIRLRLNYFRFCCYKVIRLLWINCDPYRKVIRNPLRCFEVFPHLWTSLGDSRSLCDPTGKKNCEYIGKKKTHRAQFWRLYVSFLVTRLVGCSFISQQKDFSRLNHTFSRVFNYNSSVERTYFPRKVPCKKVLVAAPATCTLPPPRSF